MASSARIAGDRAEALAEIRAYAQIGQALGAPLVRVFGGGEFAEEDRDAAREGAIGTLREAAEIAEEYGVTIVLETHDRWITGAALRPILEAVDSPRGGGPVGRAPSLPDGRGGAGGDLGGNRAVGAVHALEGLAPGRERGGRAPAVPDRGGGTSPWRRPTRCCGRAGTTGG